MKGYHISSIKSRDLILKDGLIPMLGKRAKRCGETSEKIYFSTNIDVILKLLNNRRFNSDPEFSDGIDIWSFEIPPDLYIIPDLNFNMGFFIKDHINSSMLELYKSFYWKR